MELSIYEQLDKVLNEYKQKERAKIDEVRFNPMDFNAISSSSLLQYGKDIEALRNRINNVSVTECNINIRDQILQPYRQKVISQQKEIEEINSDTSRKLEIRKAEHAKAIKKLEEKAQDYYDELYAELAPLLEKQEELSKHRDRLLEIMKLYNINPVEFEINPDAPQEEIAKMYDLAMYGIKNTIKDSTVLESILSLLYYPLKVSEESDYKEWLQWAHLAALVVLVIIAKPYFLGTVSIVYISVLLGRIVKVRDLKKVISLAYTLTEDIDLVSPLQDNVEYKRLLQDIEDFKADTTELDKDLAKIREEATTDVTGLLSSDVKALYTKAELEFNKEVENISAMQKLATTECRRYLTEKVNAIEGHYNDYLEYLKAKSKEWSFLAESIKPDRVLSNTFKIGTYSHEGISIMEEEVEIPMKSIAFKYKGEAHRQELINFMKVMLLNYMTNVREKYMEVVVYDSEDLGRDFAEFRVTNPESLFSFVTSDFDNLIRDEIIPGVSESIAKTGQRTIQEFNREADPLGKITLNYKLLIVLSTDDELDIATNKELTKLMDYAHNQGTIIWTLNKDLVKVEPRDKAKLEAFYDNDIGICTAPYHITYKDGETFNPVIPDLKYYKYDLDLGNKYLNTMTATLEENRVDILDYEEGYRKRYVPDDKIWTKSTRKGIDIRLGLLDGDPDKPHTVRLGDDAVHALMAGATGAGKSATINFCLAGLLHDYPPEELEMVMIDFKNVEFAMYTGANSIPHAKVISGTKDGEYAISVFQYLMDEMTRRTELFEQNKVQKLEEYNDLMESKGLKHLILPRVMLLIDEFQVMFTEVDPKATDKIREMITSLSKLARFCGCHMWFTSQSMSNTVPKDILDQFKLRIALSCSSDTSTSLIGDKSAARLPKKGFLISNDTAGEDTTVSKKWRIPFIPNKHIKVYVPRLKGMVEEQGRIDRKPDFYNENDEHESTEIDDFYNTNPHLREAQGLLVLGPRTGFSLNNAPTNVILQRDDGEHIIATGFERHALMSIALTVIENVKNRKNTKLVVNCPDSDSRILMDLENRLDPNVRPLLTQDFTAYHMLEFINNNIEARTENPDLCNNELYIVLINWEKMDKFGRGVDYSLQDKFKLALQKAAILNIHVVLIMREMAELRTMIPTFNHRIVAYTTDKDSNIIMESSAANKLNKLTAIHIYGSDQNKFKLYNHEYKGELAPREIVI